MRRRVSFRLRETRAGRTSVILLLFVFVIIMAGGEGGGAFSASSSSSTASGTTTSSTTNNAGDTGSSSSSIPQLLPSDPNDVATTKLPSIKLGETIRFEQFGTSLTRKTRNFTNSVDTSSSFVFVLLWRRQYRDATGFGCYSGDHQIIISSIVLRFYFNTCS